MRKKVGQQRHTHFERKMLLGMDNGCLPFWRAECMSSYRNPKVKLIIVRNSVLIFRKICLGYFMRQRYKCYLCR